MSEYPGRRRVALVGAGFIAPFHLRALSTLADVDVVALCDRDTVRAQSVARQWRVPGVFAELEPMLCEARPEAVHIVAPPALHAHLTVQCLEGGAHVLVEKPLCLTTDETARVAEAAARSGRVVAVNHNAVFHPAFQRLVHDVRDWRLGQVQHVTACVNVPLRQLTAGQHGHWMFQEPGNIILEQAPHPLSQIVHLLGPVRAAQVQSGQVTTLSTGKRFTAEWQVSLQCERGSAQLYLAFGREHLDQWLQVIGQDGSASLDLKRNTIQWSGKTRFLEAVDHLLISTGAGTSLLGQGIGNFLAYAQAFLGLRGPSDPFLRGMQGSIASFHKALRTQQEPVNSLQRGIAVIDACEQIIAAAAARPMPVREAQHA